jgi:hypothetical protein
MRFFAVAGFLVVGCAVLAAQTSSLSPAAPQNPVPGAANSPALAPLPAAPPPIPTPPQINDAKIGFSYGLPADWQTQVSQLTKPDVPFPTAEGPKKGNACAQVELTARHGTPFSVVVVVALPFDCYGQPLTSKNLADLASGASEGLKQTFDVTDSAVGNYALGSHTMWIQRASGTVKGQPAAKYTLDTVCTVLAKGFVCWWTMAADAANLQTFEQQPVTLEGDKFDAIVPAGAIQTQVPVANKPS